MRHPLRLGFLTHLEGVGDAKRIYAETLELLIAADELGFDVGWVAQHHFQALAGRLPSPFPFLAAAAVHTRRIRLGTALVLLPLEHPLRVAEDAAVVDLLSSGRLELGVGSGFDPVAFRAFGVDIEQRRQLTAQGIVTIQRALRGEPLDTTGATLHPPAAGLAERMWQAVLTVYGAEAAAKHGVGLILNRAAYGHSLPTDQVQLPWVQAYLAGLQGQTTQPRVALSRTIYPADDRPSALADLEEGVVRFAAQVARDGYLPADLSVVEYAARLHILHGHPQELVAAVQADRILPSATDLLCQFSPGLPTLAQAVRALERIATEVAPALGWQPRAPTANA
jgi:alkanesulfonate monooxygenase SsuD/methylene tetrahydromethanopterin reductase-like flavin-dependent oxidoreductase (luciferase family)